MRTAPEGALGRKARKADAMTEVELTRLLSDLRQTAKDLNRESNSINDIISRLEVTLREVNLGIDVWLTSSPVSTEHWIKEDDDGDTTVEGECEEQLGFVKLDTWQLAVRTATYRTNDGNYELLETSRATRLLDASRDTRIAALGKFPVLIKQMQAQAQAALKAIEDAKKLVK